MHIRLRLTMRGDRKSIFLIATRLYTTWELVTPAAAYLKPGAMMNYLNEHAPKFNPTLISHEVHAWLLMQR